MPLIQEVSRKSVFATVTPGDVSDHKIENNKKSAQL